MIYRIFDNLGKPAKGKHSTPDWRAMLNKGWVINKLPPIIE